MITKLQNSILKSLFFSILLCGSIPVIEACNVNASFTVSVDNNRTITINNTSTGANRYQWILGDGNTSGQTSPVHQYNTLGVYRIYLTAYDTTENNCYDTATYTLDVPGCRIKADFRYKVDDEYNVHFTNYSEYYNSGFVEFHWEFGDPHYSTLKDPIYNYNSNNVVMTYNVQLKVRDTSLGNCRDSIMIQITPLQPCDTNDFTYNFITDKKVKFTPKDTVGYSYSWSFGSGFDSNDKFPEIEYLYNGTYRVYLIFRKDKYRECQDSTFKDVEVEGCYVNSSFHIGRDTTSTFSGFIYNSSYTARPSKTTLMWYFGDGDSSSSSTPTHTYPGAGLYNLCLVIKDSICISTYCDTIGFDGNGQMLAMPFSIKVIDESNLSSLESINSGSSKFSIYPNPSNGSYQLKADQNGTYTIINAYGKVVLNALVTDNVTSVDLSSFADGIYFLQFTDQTGRTGQVKLIKSH